MNNVTSLTNLFGTSPMSKETENKPTKNNDGNHGCGIFVDLKTAFDTVNHLILFKKLEHYGIRAIPLEWFSNRKQCV